MAVCSINGCSNDTDIDSSAIIATEYVKIKNHPNDSDYFDNTRGIDNFFDNIQEIREEVITRLITDPELFTSEIWTNDMPLPIDETCKFCVGFDQPSLSERLNSDMEQKEARRYIYKCHTCKNINRIERLINKDMTKPLKVRTGSNTNLQLHVTKNPTNFQLFLTTSRSQIIKKRIKNIIRKSNIVSCEPGIRNLISDSSFFMGGDKFTINSLVHLSVNRVLDEIGLDTVVRLYLPFICGDNGFQLKEYIETNYNINNSIYNKSKLLDVLFQIISTIHYLKIFNFTLGNISSDSIKIINQRDLVSYDSVSREVSMKIKLDNLEESSMSLYSSNSISTRLYCMSMSSEKVLSSKPFQPNIFQIQLSDIDSIDDDSINDSTKESYFKLDENVPTITYLRNSGIPIFQSSLNTYIYILLLMSNLSIRNIVYQDSELNTLWSKMWLPIELDDVNSGITELENVNIEIILNFLKKYMLKCNMTEIYWSSLKAIL